jgi:hypothetical protein
MKQCDTITSATDTNQLSVLETVSEEIAEEGITSYKISLGSEMRVGQQWQQQSSQLMTHE